MLLFKRILLLLHILCHTTLSRKNKDVKRIGNIYKNMIMFIIKHLAEIQIKFQGTFLSTNWYEKYTYLIILLRSYYQNQEQNYGSNHNYKSRNELDTEGDVDYKNFTNNNFRPRRNSIKDYPAPPPPPINYNSNDSSRNRLNYNMNKRLKDQTNTTYSRRLNPVEEMKSFVRNSNTEVYMYTIDMFII